MFFLRCHYEEGKDKRNSRPGFPERPGRTSLFTVCSRLLHPRPRPQKQGFRVCLGSQRLLWPKRNKKDRGSCCGLFIVLPPRLPCWPVCLLASGNPEHLQSSSCLCLCIDHSDALKLLPKCSSSHKVSHATTKDTSGDLLCQCLSRRRHSLLHPWASPQPGRCLPWPLQDLLLLPGLEFAALSPASPRTPFVLLRTENVPCLHSMAQTTIEVKFSRFIQDDSVELKVQAKIWILFYLFFLVFSSSVLLSAKYNCWAKKGH